MHSVPALLPLFTIRRYEITPPGSDTDRVCRAITKCGADQFEDVAPTASTDRVCLDSTTCGGGEFEAVPLTASADRACSTCRICSSSQYANSACTANSNTVCASCTVCEAGVTYASTPCTTGADSDCAPCSLCDGPDQFVSSACTSNADATCSDITTDFTYSEWSEWSASCATQRRTRKQQCKDRACKNPQPTEEQRSVNGGCEQLCSVIPIAPLGNPAVVCDCHDGFLLQTDKATCTPRSCGATPSLPHATADTAGTELTFGMAAVFSCDIGYGLSGLTDTRTFSRTCQADGTLGNTGAVCEDINECSSGLDNCATACTNLDGSHCCAVNADAEYSQWSPWAPSCGPAVRTRSQLACAATCGGLCLNQQSVREDRTTCCPDNTQPFIYGEYQPFQASCQRQERTRPESCAATCGGSCHSKQDTSEVLENGGCMHACLETVSAGFPTVVCSCDGGFDLAPDGKTCITSSPCKVSASED